MQNFLISLCRYCRRACRPPAVCVPISRIGGIKMKVIFTSKNFNASDHLKDTIEKKIGKLSKYFAKDIVANITLSMERGRQKMEATINADGR